MGAAIGANRHLTIRPEIYKETTREAGAKIAASRFRLQTKSPGNTNIPIRTCSSQGAEELFLPKLNWY